VQQQLQQLQQQLLLLSQAKSKAPGELAATGITSSSALGLMAGSCCRTGLA
jgi:hypothetical protein